MATGRDFEWERHLRPHLMSVARQLCPRRHLLVARLYSKQLINEDEEERFRMSEKPETQLALDILSVLRRQPAASFDDFCDVLLQADDPTLHEVEKSLRPRRNSIDDREEAKPPIIAAAVTCTSRDLPVASRESCEDEVELTSRDSDESWSAIQRNYSFLSQRLAFSREFLSHLYEQRFISKDDFSSLRSSSLTQEANVHRLLVDILPSKPTVMFPAFCNILHSVGQSHVAERLEQDIKREDISSQAASQRQGSSGLQDAEETLTAQVARLEREKTAAVRRADEEKLRADGGEWANLALRCDKAQHDDETTINDSLPLWTQWNVPIPRDSYLSCGRMVEMEGRLVVAGDDGNLHVLTDEGDKWDTFVRKKGNIRNVVCHQGVCLVCVKDNDQDQFVIEQFDLNGVKWRSLTVLPNELQLDGVSVALHNNSLYVVGGETTPLDMVTTSRVYDLHNDHWSKMDDMKIQRSCCSVVINNTVFVGGGAIDGEYFILNNTVECADVRVREWRTIPSTTNYGSTLTAVSNRLVVTGGQTQQRFGSPSNVVELYDERPTKWLYLPQMTEKRWGHAALSSHNGELITAGG